MGSARHIVEPPECGPSRQPRPLANRTTPPSQPTLTGGESCRKVRRIVGLTEQGGGLGKGRGAWAPGGHGRVGADGRACARGDRGLQLAEPARPRRASADVPPQQVERIQQISERAQAAIDRGDYEHAAGRPDPPGGRGAGVGRGAPAAGLGPDAPGAARGSGGCFHAALARDHDYVEAMLGLGQVEAERGDTATALKRFELAISIDPRRPKAHYLLGRVREAVGQTDEALAAYFRALEFDANDAQSIVRIAAIQLARSQPDQALSRLDQAVELSPDRRRGPLAAGPGALEAAPPPRGDRRPPRRRPAAARPAGHLLQPRPGPRGRPQAGRRPFRRRAGPPPGPDRLRRPRALRTAQTLIRSRRTPAAARTLGPSLARRLLESPSASAACDPLRIATHHRC